MIRQLAQDIEKLLSSTSIVLSSDFQKHFGTSDETLYIKGSVIFIDASLLSIALFFVKLGNKIQLGKYRYQYMDSRGEMLFRYDNANHHPELKTFPQHKHLGSIVIEAEAPDIKDIINEISAIILKTN